MFLQVFFWAVPIGVSACFALLILFFAISKKDKYIKAFMPLIVFMLLWSLSSLFMKLQVYPGELFWNKMMVGSLCFVPICIYGFFLVFANYFSIKRIIGWIIITVVPLTLNFMGLVVTDAKMVTIPGTLEAEFQYSLGWGAIPTYFTLFALLISIVISVRILVSRGQITTKQINPIIIGVFVMFLGQMLNILPQVGKYPFDLLLGFINAIFILVAIFKHRMLELKFVLTRGIIYALVTTALIVAYIFAVLNLQALAPLMNLPLIPYLNTIIALAAALLLQPLLMLTKRLIDRAFYKTEYTHRNALRDFSVNITNRLDLSEITAELIDAIKNAIGSTKVYLMLRNDGDEYYYCYNPQSILDNSFDFISKDNPIINWFSTKNECITKDTLNYFPLFKAMWDNEKKTLNNLEIEVIVPIKCRNNLIGMIFISKKSNNSAYTLDDIDLLTSLGASTAVAIDNARLYNLAQEEAISDDLTKLYNHRYFHKQLDSLVTESKNSELSLIMLDIDMFKLYNDLYGHIEGDKALQKIAHIMESAISGNGTISRYSGGKFAILLPFYDSAKSYSLAEKIRKAAQETFIYSIDATQRFLTISAGICTYPHFAGNKNDLLTRADIALYKAKNNGKNQTVVYSPSSSMDDASSIDYSGGHSTTVYALTAAIDAKDHFTFGHSQNVAEYSTILAEALGLDSAHVDMIREAALLHDIGKIGIPEYILTKPEQLTQTEYEIMKKHVEMSITIVKHLPSLNHVIPSIVSHHERWDGKGYPRGLRGEGIPIGARCLAIADSFDAITSYRPYKSPMPVEFALREIEMQMGKQFDPDIAQVFIDLVKAGKINVKMLKVLKV